MNQEWFVNVLVLVGRVFEIKGVVEVKVISGGIGRFQML